MTFAVSSLAGWAAVTLAALRWRGRAYAAYAALVLGVHALAAVSLFHAFAAPWPVYGYLQVAVFAHFLGLLRPRLRPWWWRLLVSLPAMYFVGATLLAVPWLLAATVGAPSWLLGLPLALAGVGVVESLTARRSQVDIALDGFPVRAGAPVRHRHGTRRSPRPLRVVQITDPHLGPWMPVRRFRRICERAVASKPDLVVLTGDLLTVESNDAVEALAEALSPLRAMHGRVFACRGNHDLEAPGTVARGLAAAGVKLLVDELQRVETPAGPVEVLGIDHHFRGRRERIASACAAHPRSPDVPRLVLLHDPGAFKHVPDGEADLVLSGHTHGGQIGVLTLGLRWTLLRLLSSMPDHGLWALGRNRLYVHRGTGHYGFPLRLGVPAEESVLRLHVTGCGGPDPGSSEARA